MEHRKETDLGSEMLGVEGNLQKSFGAGPEQQIVEELLVLQHEWTELVRQGKHYVEVADGEQFFFGLFADAPDPWWSEAVEHARVTLNLNDYYGDISDRSRRRHARRMTDGIDCCPHALDQRRPLSLDLRNRDTVLS